jgi:deazaflavin-dependent oxidoreductase (nitroreductase family)
MEFSMQGNDFIKFILRTPFHAMFGGNLMLITVTGRKSGRAITTPVNYYREENTLWVISKRERKWWRNLCEGAEVTLRLNGHDVKAQAESITDEQVVADQIGEYVRHIPISAKPLGVRLQNGLVNCEDANRLAKERLFVKIQLKT